MQYTVRNIPDALDAELRERAREQKKSLNKVALETLARGLGLSKETVRYRNLNDVAGSWKEDPAFDQAIADQDTIDPELWK